MPEDFMTRSEAMAVLGVSQTTIIGYTQRGRLPQYGGGKSGLPARYKREDVLSLKREREERAYRPLAVQ